MIVKCSNGHEFDDRDSWECPLCEKERLRKGTSLGEATLDDLFGGRLG